jgi:hypothetical protein
MARAIILLLSITLLQAANSIDSAVFRAFQKADSGLKHFALLQRTGVTGELDLVIAVGSAKERLVDRASWTWWSEERKIGLWLQEKGRPERVYLLGVKSGFPDCAARIERVTPTDSVISCVGEKSARYPNQKWVYDVRAKSLVRQFSYQPFGTYRVFSSVDQAVFVASDSQRLVAIEYKPKRDPEFRVLSAAESPKWLRQIKVSEATEGIDRKRVLHIESEPFQPVRFGPSGSFELVRLESA